MVERYITTTRRIWLYSLAGGLILFLTLPIFLILPMSFSGSSLLHFPPTVWSFRWYVAYFESRSWIAGTVISFEAAFLTVLIATPVGAAAAYGIHRTRGWIADVISGILLAPLFVPVILIGVGIFFVFAPLKLVNSILALALSHSMLAIPFVFVTVLAALKSFDMTQENVARSLGANRLIAFLTVTLPQIRPGIVTGAFLAFITSFDEVIVAMFVTGGANATLPKLMFMEMRDTIDPTIAAISTLLATGAALLLAVSELTKAGLGHSGAASASK
jgi:putative spermidine/putrescine transport system permease protein